MRVMVRRSLTQRRPHLPRPRGSEHSKNPEENPGQLQPQRARQLHQAAPTPPRQSACRPPSGPAPSAAPAPSSERPSPPAVQRRPPPYPKPQSDPLRHWNRTRSLFRLYLRRRVRRRRRIHGRHQRLGRCTGPDTKRTTKSNRIHTQSVAVPPPTMKPLRIPLHQMTVQPLAPTIAAMEILEKQPGVLAVQPAGADLHLFVDPKITSPDRLCADLSVRLIAPSYRRSKTCSSRWCGKRRSRHAA